MDSAHLMDYENDYDDSNNVTLSSHHLNDTNNRNNSNSINNNSCSDEVVIEEVTSEGCEGYDVVKNEGEEVKTDDLDSIDFLFNEDNEDDEEVDEALHLPPHNTSHNLVGDNDVSLSDFFYSDEEKE